MKHDRHKLRRVVARKADRRIAAVVLVGQAVVFAKLVLVVTVFDPRAADTFTLPKSAVSHSLAILLAGLVVGAFIVGATRTAQITWLDVAVFATFSAFALASLLAVDQTLAFFGTPRRFLGLTHQADLLVTYAGVRAFFSERSDWKRLLTVVLATTVPVVAYAFIQRAGLDPLHFDVETTRPISTFGNQDIIGGYLGIALATAFGVAVMFWQVLRLGGRVGVLAVGATCGVAMIFVENRGGVLGASAGWVAALALSRIGPSASSRSRRVVWAAVGTVVLAGAIFASPLGARFNVTRLGADTSVLVRLEIWRAALSAVAARPVLGLGPDNFVAVYPSIRAEESVLLNGGPDVFQNSTHDVLLNVLTSAGLVGATLFVAVLILAAVAGVRAAHKRDVTAFALVPLAAYLAQGIVNVNDVTLDWIPYVCVAAVAAGSRPLRSVPVPRTPQIERWLVLAGAVLMTGLIAVLSLSRIGASEYEFRARSLLAQNRPLEAVAQAQQAISLDPRRAIYWSIFGTALAAAGSQSGAISAFQEAISRDPWQAFYWRNVGIARISLGDRPNAVIALKRAVELDRYDVIALDLLARVSYNDGDYAAAASYGARAAHAYPPRSESYDALVAADIQLGRPGDAEAALLRGLSMAQPSTMRILLAKTYIAEGRTADASQQLDLVLAAEPANPAALALKRQIAP